MEEKTFTMDTLVVVDGLSRDAKDLLRTWKDELSESAYDSIHRWINQKMWKITSLLPQETIKYLHHKYLIEDTPVKKRFHTQIITKETNIETDKIVYSPC